MKIVFTEHTGLRIRWTCFGVNVGLALGLLCGGFFESASINAFAAVAILALCLVYEE